MASSSVIYDISKAASSRNFIDGVDDSAVKVFGTLLAALAAWMLVCLLARPYLDRKARKTAAHQAKQRSIITGCPWHTFLVGCALPRRAEESNERLSNLAKLYVRTNGMALRTM